jgi:hypothetical protein
MPKSKRARIAGWSALLAEPGGPNGAYDEVLRIVRRIGEGPRDEIEARGLVAFGEAISAIATLRGSAAAREALVMVPGILEEINLGLTLSPGSIDDLATLSLLTSIAVCEPIGVRLELPALDVGKALDRFSVQKLFSRENKITAALIALSINHPKPVRFILIGPGTPPKASDPADPLALVRILATALEGEAPAGVSAAAWETFLTGFPSALHEKRAQWNHLLLSARIVMAQLGNVPMADVADTLHRRVVELAAAESS